MQPGHIQLVPVARNYLSYYTGGVSPLPIGYFVISITYACNCHCIMCHIWKEYRDNPERRAQELDCDVWLNKLANASLTLARAEVDFTGGEPFLKPGFIPFLSEVMRLPRIRSIRIATNGALTDTIVSGLEEVLRHTPAGNRLSIGISLDGVDELHDEIRGTPGAFSRASQTLKALAQLSERHPQLTVAVFCLLQPRNIDTVENLMEHCRALSVRCSLGIIQETPNNRNVGLGYDARGFTEAQQAKVRRLCWYPGLTRWFEDSKRPLKCYAGYSSVSFDPYGNMYPCVTMSGVGDFGMGNIAQAEIDEAWLSRRAWEVRHRVKRCTHSDCWTGCEIDATLVQHQPFDRLVRGLTRHRLTYYRLRGL